ncbi:hypothetical protein Tco_0537233, partial [Tanacetum coccineum]
NVRNVSSIGLGRSDKG